MEYTYLWASTRGQKTVACDQMRCWHWDGSKASYGQWNRDECKAGSSESDESDGLCKFCVWVSIVCFI